MRNLHEENNIKATCFFKGEKACSFFPSFHPKMKIVAPNTNFSMRLL